MIRIGVVGFGGWGRRLAADAAETAGAGVVAVADPDPDQRAAAGSEHDLPAAARFADAETMYAEAPLDAVVVASPPAFHHEQVLAALDRGLHVLCEKPMVVTTVEARDVAARATDADPTVVVDYQRHLDPAYRAAFDRWSGSDHTPRHLTCEFAQDWSDYLESGTNWRTEPSVGGWGHLFSVGTHVVEAMLWTTGLKPASVAAEMDFHDDDRRIDVRSALAVRFESGATATISDVATAATHREHLRGWDDEGAFAVVTEDWEPPRLQVVDGDGTRRHPEVDHDATPSTIEAFLEAIESGDPPATAEDGLRVTALLEAAYESARTGERVTVELE